MDKTDYGSEMSAGPVSVGGTKQGSFNSDGKTVKEPGKESALMGAANTNGPHAVVFAKKSENMKAKVAAFTKTEDHELIKNAGK